MVSRKVAVFSLRRMHGLIKSAAYARAAQKYTTLVRPRFSENRGWNAVVKAITGEPGFAEIATDVQAIDFEQQRASVALMDGAFLAMAMGPPAFIAYLQKVEADREADLQAMQAVYRSAINISRHIDGDLNTAVRTCSVIKFASTIVVASTPVGLTFAGASTAVGTAWVAFGFSVTKSLAKDYAEARNSGVIAFETSASAKEDPVHIAKRIGDDLAERFAKRLEERVEGQHDLIAEAERKIAELSRSVARKVSLRKIAKLGRRIEDAEAKVAGAARSIKWATAGQWAARTFQIAFAAHDIYEGWEDCEREWGHGQSHAGSHAGSHGGAAH